MKIRSFLSVVPVALLALSACTITTGQPQPATPATTATPAATATPATTTTPAATTTTPAPKLKVHGSAENKQKEATPATTTTGKDMTAANIFGTPTAASAASFKGVVYWLPTDTKTLPALDTLTPATTLYTDAFNIAPKAFNEGFPGVDATRVEWFAIRYTGNFAVAVDGDYKFRVLSKDGAKVYIDNAPVVNNDGVHPPQSKTETIKLAVGAHTIQLDYFQGKKGQVALQVFVTGPDGKEKSFVSAI